MLITSERDTSDSYALGARAEPMSLPAQMLRAFLPPRTVRTDRVVATAVLEPAYDLGGRIPPVVPQRDGGRPVGDADVGCVVSALTR
ncbi:hypothetical protein [Kitasatospora aureofaciens]|uniref:hypothetical protein n=1 Tax=Kitasatospora aureofaciens TaxID=1894 RepID=UPI0005245EE4